MYDVLDRIREIQYNIGSGGAFETAYSYEYNTDGQLYCVHDHVNSEVTLFYYDSNGRLTGSTVYSSDELETKYGSVILYDEESRIKINKEYLNYIYSYIEDMSFLTLTDTAVLEMEKSYTYSDNELATITAKVGDITLTVTPTYDSLRRATTMTYAYSTGIANTVTYLFEGNSSDSQRTSNVISQMTSTVGTASTTYKYTYDANGNITEIRNGSGTLMMRYQYDPLGQVIREDNMVSGYTYMMTYDNAGNITSKKVYPYTLGTPSGSGTVYSYGYSSSSWGDQLTSINGKPITYDGIGNPIQIGAIGEHDSATLTWQGRQLQSYTKYYMDIVDIYSDVVTYTYNDEGIRTSKTVNGQIHEYILNGSQIVAEKFGDKFIVYMYDETGSPIGLMYRTDSYAEGTFDTFFFEKNLQGDIVAIYNVSGEKIGTYTYDAWGVHTTATVSGNTSLENLIVTTYNPFRYRGYYYDVDTELYYLQSRYYNPEWGRFISSDTSDVIAATPDQLTDKNLFAYCDNNPIMRTDEDGEFWATITGAIFGAISGGIEAYKNGDNIWAGIGIGAAVGAISGLAVDASIATGGLAGFAIAAAGGAISSVVGDVATEYANGGSIGLDDLGEIAVNAFISAGSNLLSFGMGSGDGIKTGAKTLKQVFQYSKENSLNMLFANPGGKIPNSSKRKVINSVRNGSFDILSSVILGGEFELLEKSAKRMVGIG